MFDSTSSPQRRSDRPSRWCRSRVGERAAVFAGALLGRLSSGQLSLDRRVATGTAASFGTAVAELAWLRSLAEAGGRDPYALAPGMQVHRQQVRNALEAELIKTADQLHQVRDSLREQLRPQECFPREQAQRLRNPRAVVLAAETINRAGWLLALLDRARVPRNQVDFARPLGPSLHSLLAEVDLVALRWRNQAAQRLPHDGQAWRALISAAGIDEIKPQSGRRPF